MAHKIYDNFYLSNEVEDQFNSHLDLQQFCTVDNSLVGTAGMKRKINVYKATAGTEKLKMGEGNTKSIEVSFTPEEYEIQLAQNKFQYYDEQEMTDPMLVPVGTRHMGTDIFKDNLSTMKVSDGETETTYTDMVFIQQMEWADGTFYLAFREKTKEEKLVAALNATSNSITDVQVALAEVYEMVLGGN